MTKDAKVTTETIATGDVYKRFGQLTKTANHARPELGELPITYVLNRSERVAAILPAWLAEWIERNADTVMAAIKKESAEG